MAAPARLCTAGSPLALLRRPATALPGGPALNICLRLRGRSLHRTSPAAAAAPRPKAAAAAAQKPTTRRVIARKSPSPPQPSSVPGTSSPPPPQRPPGPKEGQDEEKQSLSDIVAQRRLPLVGAALAAGLLGLYVSYLAATLLKDSSCPSCHTASAEEPATTTTPTGRPPQELTRATAAQFDASLDWPERLMGITRLRRRMARLASGHVLEVAVGTGRNLALYDWDDVAAYTTATSPDSSSPSSSPAAAADQDGDAAALQEEGRRKLRRLEKTGFKASSSDVAVAEVTSFTGVDISPDVLEVARSKLRAAVPGGKRALKKRFRSAWGTGTPLDDAGKVVEIANAAGGRLRLIQSDAQLPLPAPPTLDNNNNNSSTTGTSSRHPGAREPPRKYDTVLQTFGLCSVGRPAQVLSRLAAAVEPDTGRIVLLEHGRGRWAAVNRLLDRYAGRHHERFGCWWNRDIEGIVRAAAAEVPGLEVVAVERPGFLQFGTMLWIELRVRSSSGGGGGAAAAAAAPGGGK
ncbi:uncharacterized protein E0L32_011854 [Thyridium curvatum]|uniref:S-adenosyl-L-methionine-dependent methyltransferase n=1 Tax=Thyridium curvatum TaxID=1093900 RepID=A0A507BH16_9PEZI|nr:uncharacterized protein E0L32_011854 [Thyridium curvatum]TPX18084.1 hypothetical protein E0L32_011854 [Thyridium curvatum]